MLLGTCLGVFSWAGVAGPFTVHAADPWDAADMKFLSDLTRDVVNASKVKPGAKVGGSPTNTSGITLIKPGGGAVYPSFWVRDFSMSLESGFITPTEMLEHLRFIAGIQNGATELKLLNGMVVPPYAIPDHINFDSKQVWYPGTYDSGNNQGTGDWGNLPPIDDHYEFLHIAYCLYKATGKLDFLKDTVNSKTILERLTLAFNSPISDEHTGLAMTDAARRAVGFGFCDGIYLTGKVFFPSLLRWRAADEFAEIHQALGEDDLAKGYIAIKARIAEHLIPTFSEPTRIKGWLMGATLVGRQPDVWGTAFALHLGVISGEAAKPLIEALVDGVKRKTMVFEGAVRHVPTDYNFSSTTAWERAVVPINTYQNGAFWHTPTGWVIEAIQKSDTALATQLFNDMIKHLRTKDYRLSPSNNAPWECFHSSGYAQNQIYMTSVTLPFAVLNNPAKPVSILRGRAAIIAPLHQEEGTFTAYGINGATITRMHESEKDDSYSPANGLYFLRYQAKDQTADKKVVAPK